MRVWPRLRIRRVSSPMFGFEAEQAGDDLEVVLDPVMDLLEEELFFPERNPKGLEGFLNPELGQLALGDVDRESGQDGGACPRRESET